METIKQVSKNLSELGQVLVKPNNQAVSNESQAQVKAEKFYRMTVGLGRMTVVLTDINDHVGRADFLAENGELLATVTPGTGLSVLRLIANHVEVE